MAAILNNLRNTIGVGLVLAFIMLVAFAQASPHHFNDMAYWQAVFRWMHVVFGILWIGLLYFFKLVGTPTLKGLEPAVRAKIFPALMSRAMLWFRWSALITVIAGWNVERDSFKRGLAEKAHRESEDKYRRLVQGVQDYAILMLGPLGEIRSWNPGAERMTRCKFEEVVGQNFSRFFPPEDLKRGRPSEILRLAAEAGIYEERGMRAQDNGHLTTQDRRTINHQQNQESRRIYRDKHNNFVR